MRLPLTRLENISLTIIIIPLTLSPLCLVLLVRLGGRNQTGDPSTFAGEDENDELRRGMKGHVDKVRTMETLCQVLKIFFLKCLTDNCN